MFETLKGMCHLKFKINNSTPIKQKSIVAKCLVIYVNRMIYLLIKICFQKKIISILNNYCSIYKNINMPTSFLQFEVPLQ